MPIYGEKHLKIFFSRIKKASRLNLVTKHWGLKVIQVYSNVDPRLTFDLFTAWSNMRPYAFVWGKHWKFSFSICIKDQWLKLTMYDQSSNPFQLQSKFCPPGLSALAPGLYTCIKSRNLWTSSFLNSLANFHQISHWAFCWKRIINLFKRFCIIKQDGHHAHIWWKTLKNLLLQNNESFKLESCYRALGTEGHPSLFKWWSSIGQILRLFCAFVWGKYWKFSF